MCRSVLIFVNSPVLRTKIILVCLLVGYMIVCDTAQGEYKCRGQIYKIKSKSAPLFSEPDATSAVLSHLEQGDRVCYVGEQGEFIIVDRRSLPTSVQLKLAVADAEDRSPNGLVFVRQVDSRSISGSNKESTGVLAALNRFVSYLENWKNGVVPDDGLAPYGPFIDLFHSRVPEGEVLTNGTGSLPADRGKWDSSLPQVDQSQAKKKFDPNGTAP